MWRKTLPPKIPVLQPNILLNNMATNGNMETGSPTPDGWTPNHADFTGMSRGVSTEQAKFGTKSYKYASSGTNTVANNARLERTYATVAGRKYYYSAWVYSSVVGKAGVVIDSGNVITNTKINQWERIGGYFTATAASHIVRIYGAYSNANTAVTTYIDGAIFFDVTDAFGSGKEPLQAPLESLLAQFNYYFDAQQLTQWTNQFSGKAMGVVGDAVGMFTAGALATHEISSKTIVCFGDSITANGEYVAKVRQKTGLNVVNAGFGGCCMAFHSDVNYDKFSMTKIADAIVSGNWSLQDTANTNLVGQFTTNLNALKAVNFANVDCITIFYGTNDFAANVPIGLDTDSGSTTFKGAINYVANTIMTAFPHLRIIFASPMWRARIVAGDGKDVDTNTNTNGAYLFDFVDAEVKLANANKFPAIDMYRTSGINKFNATYFLSDGLHPNQLGGDRIGRIIASKIIEGS